MSMRTVLSVAMRPATTVRALARSMSSSLTPKDSVLEKAVTPTLERNLVEADILSGMDSTLFCQTI